MNLKKHIPNLLTSCNLMCGCLGVIVTLIGFNTTMAFYLIIAACVFDFFDGFAARLLKVSSPIGKDLDSLADMVTFGVMPGVMLFETMPLVTPLVFNLFNKNVNQLLPLPVEQISFAAYLSLVPLLLIPVFSALRLAKFNNDTRQSDKFIGLPTPANALLIGSVVVLIDRNDLLNGYSIDKITPTYYLVAFTLLSCYLLVAELPLIALKFKNFAWKGNELRYLLIISALVLLVTLNILAIPIIVILYIILSVIETLFIRSKDAIA